MQVAPIVEDPLRHMTPKQTEALDDEVMLHTIPRNTAVKGAYSSLTDSPSSVVSGSRPRKSMSLFRRSKKKTKPVSLDVVDDNLNPDDDDPVMNLFRSRTTQRVRFSLEGPVPKASVSKGSPNALGLKKFMKGSLFGKGVKNEELEAEIAREIESVPSAEMERSGPRASPTLPTTPDRETRAQVTKLLNKARRAQYIHFRYEYAVKCLVRASDLLKDAPSDNSIVTKTMQALDSAHFMLHTFRNSANIVKMGIKYEDTGELIRALKMYTIAYRMRRDTLSRAHPSLVVLLNMLGSLQMKRGELEEAMQIYELALQDAPIEMEDDMDDEEERRPPVKNLLTRSVTYREMGTVHEQWGDYDQALVMYQKSLDCLSEYKGLSLVAANEQACDILHDLEQTHLDSDAYVTSTEVVQTDDRAGGMELCIGRQVAGAKVDQNAVASMSRYDLYFPPSLDELIKKKSWKGKKDKKKGDYADLDAALTLHQIAQLHRAKREYAPALAAFRVSLRGMKYVLGKYHPNVAAILGNIGNLRKEMDDMDAAFETYQQVLAIESYRLGLSHPDVTITLHNIATIDAARGNHEHALSLYKQVLDLQRKHFGAEHVSVAVTAACMGDVLERLGNLKEAKDSFEEALRIKSAALGHHSLEVARILHKLGKLSFGLGDYYLSDSFLSRGLFVYRLNGLMEDDEWMVDAKRDAANVDAKLALGKGSTFEC